MGLQRPYDGERVDRYRHVPAAVLQSRGTGFPLPRLSVVVYWLGLTAHTSVLRLALVKGARLDPPRSDRRFIELCEKLRVPCVDQWGKG